MACVSVMLLSQLSSLRIIEFSYQVITGGESKTKKVTLRTTMHPSISKSLDIIKGSFARLCLKDQDILGDAERWNKVSKLDWTHSFFKIILIGRIAKLCFISSLN